MRIIHYTLGLPPYRSGGLTSYSIDVLLAEKEMGNLVSLLYPGGFSISWPIKRIKRKKDWQNVSIYEIQNTVNIPLLHGVKKPLSLMGRKYLMSQREMEQFYNKTKVEVFHVHTLMGLPLELIFFLKKKNVKIIYTSHDYYGICLKTNLIDLQNKICDSHTPNKCAICNRYAPSNIFLRLRNCKFLLSLKNRLSRLKVFISKEYQKEGGKENILGADIVENYESLLNYYKKIFKLIDVFHFNSELTKAEYSKYIEINVSNSIVIPISHAKILDCRRKKTFNKQRIKLGFIGNLTAYKGFPLLKEVLITLKREGFDNWTLGVFGNIEGTDKDSDNIFYNGKYTPTQLEDIFAEIDLLIVPSVWKETFSLVALEAISHGVPTLVSSNVGAKKIICNYNPNFVYKDESELREVLKKILIDQDLLIDYNKKIINSPWIYSFTDHVVSLLTLYINVLNK